MAKQKDKSENTLEALEKKYGVHTPKIWEQIVVPTGSIQLNRAMKIGGTALGKIYEVYGEESSGKSSCLLHQMKEYQIKFPDKKVMLLDYEYSFDKTYAESIGVDINNILVYQPTTMEDGYNLILGILPQKILSCIVIDSQTAATPKIILEGEIGDSTIGIAARLNSTFCQKVKGLLDVNQCSLFFISQLRDKIGGYGDPATTTGGKAIKFYSDVRWKVWKSADKEGHLNKTTIEVIKSKVGIPYGKANIDILHGVGFDTFGEIIDYALEFNIIEQHGAWYNIGEDKFQGKDALRKAIQEDIELFEKIKKEVLINIEKEDNGNKD